MFHTTEERFWSKVDKSAGLNECWLWKGGTTSKGYGRFWLNGHPVSATHFAIGKHVPHGVFVCHKCDNPKCVNPDHLFFGSPKANQQDMWKKGRGVTERVNRENYLRGEKHRLSKLTKENVKQIRSMYKFRKFGAARLAKLFGVSKHAIQDVLNKRTWSHI